MKAKTFHELRDRLADPLLTALTIMLAILLFVIAPLQAVGVVAAHNFGIVFGLVLVAAVFIVSESWIAVAAILLAVALIVVATVIRLRQPSIIDIYLESSAWLVTSLTLAVVVGRAVFAQGKINYHRVIGAVLLYLNIGVFFVALYGFSALLVHNAFAGFGPLEDNLNVAGNLIYFSFVTLTSVGYGDIVPLHPVVRAASPISRQSSVSCIRQHYWRGSLLCNSNIARRWNPSSNLGQRHGWCIDARDAGQMRRDPGRGSPAAVDGVWTWLIRGEGSQAMRMLIVMLSAALMLLSIPPQAGAAKSQLKCGGENLQCGSLAKVCNPKNGKCCCMNVPQ